MVPVRSCFASSTTPKDSDNGCIDWRSVHRATRWLWRSPTSWRALPGPCYPAVGNININVCSQRQLDGGGKDDALGKHRALSTFPLPRRLGLTNAPPRSAEERRDERTVQRRVGKPGGENASLVTERFIRTDTCGSSSSARRTI